MLGATSKEDWRAKYEECEARRQSLRNALKALKEAALNLPEVIKRNDELEAEVKTVTAARNKAEKNAIKLKRENADLQKEIIKLQGKVDGLQDALAASQGGGKMQAIAAELAALKDEVRQAHGHGEKKMAPQDRIPSTRLVHGDNGNGGGGGFKAAAAAAGVKRVPQIGIKAKPLSLEAQAGRDARERAVAQKNLAGKASAQTPPKKNATGAPRCAPLPPHATEHPAKRVRVSEPPVTASPAITTTRHAPEFGRREKDASLAASAGLQGEGAAATALEPHFTDLVASTLRSFLEGDADTGYLEEAVKALSPAVFDAEKRKTVVFSLASALLECAAAEPQEHVAPTSFSPHLWVESSHSRDTPKATTRDRKARVPSEHSEDVLDVQRVHGSRHQMPSFIGVWCSEDALQVHAPLWILHCASQLDRLAAEQDTPPQGKSLHKSGARHNTSVSTAPIQHALAAELSFSVVSALAAPPGALSSMELCCASAAAAAIWKALGDSKSFQAFFMDCLLAQPGAEEAALPVLAATAEVWPEAMPGKGVLGDNIRGLLRAVCGIASSKSRCLFETQAAAQWWMRLGAAQWGWDNSVNNNNNSINFKADAARHGEQLAKFA